MSTSDLPPKARQFIPRGVAGHDSGDPLRENFYALLARSYKQASSQGKAIAAYLEMARSLTELCATRWVKHFVFPTEVQLVRRFLQETAIPVADPKRVVQSSLAVHMVARTFGRELGQLGHEEFSKVCAISGKEHLDAALAAGRGVVVAHTHTVCAELFWNWLDHQGMERGLILQQWKFGKNQEASKDNNVGAIEGARELHAAMGILRAGGLVHSMADGQKGNEKLVLSVHKRLRPYLTGFASLAIRANAPVITADVFVEPDGKLSIVIGPPLELDSSAVQDEQKIDGLVRQYAKYHEQLWRDRPENIQWRFMRKHLDFPSSPDKSA